MLSLRPIAAAFAAAIFACLAAAGAVQAADPPTKVWERHPGSREGDDVWAVATDAAGDVAVAGGTLGSIGKLNEGRGDVFIIKYSSGGTVLWRRQLGTPNIDRAMGMTTDASRNIAVVGYTSGWLFGRNAGGWDGFIVSYTADGTLRWKRQIGTALDDFAEGAAVDAAGNILVAGLQGSQGLLIKYRPDGTEVWRRLLGSGYTAAQDVVVAPSGNIIVGGSTNGSFGGPNLGDFDLFLASYSPQGDQQWVRQFGTVAADFERGMAVAADGSIYLAGKQQGSTGTDHTFLVACSSTGLVSRKRTFGGQVLDEGMGVAVDPAGNVVITGQKFRQQFAASYTSTGTLQWTMTPGTRIDYQLFPAFDPAGNLFLAGAIDTPPARGYFDGYLAKFAY